MSGTEGNPTLSHGHRQASVPTASKEQSALHTTSSLLLPGKTDFSSSSPPPSPQPPKLPPPPSLHHRLQFYLCPTFVLSRIPLTRTIFFAMVQKGRDAYSLFLLPRNFSSLLFCQLSRLFSGASGRMSSYFHFLLRQNCHCSVKLNPYTNKPQIIFEAFSLFASGSRCMYLIL